MYLVWSNKHGMWWCIIKEDGKTGYGYTNDLTNAGQFTFERASVICDIANEGLEKGESLNSVMFAIPPFPMGTFTK